MSSTELERRLMELRFARSESTFDYFAASRAYLQRHGKPVVAATFEHVLTPIFHRFPDLGLESKELTPESEEPDPAKMTESKE